MAIQEKKNSNKNGIKMNGYSSITLEIHLGEWTPVVDKYTINDYLPLITGEKYNEPFCDGTIVPCKTRPIGALKAQKQWLDKSNPKDVILKLEGFCRCAPEFIVEEKDEKKEYNLVGVYII